MEPATIIFDCPHCHTRLTVPSSMAGVSGPCPSCGQTIYAPQPQQSSPTPAPAPAPAPAPPQHQHSSRPADHHDLNDLPPRRAPGELPQRGAPAFPQPQPQPQPQPASPPPAAGSPVSSPAPAPALTDDPSLWPSGAQIQLPGQLKPSAPAATPLTPSIFHSPEIVPRQAADTEVIPQQNPDFLTAAFGKGLSTPSIQPSGTLATLPFPAGAAPSFPTSAQDHAPDEISSDRGQRRRSDQRRGRGRQRSSKIPLLSAIGAILVGVLVASALLLAPHLGRPDTATSQRGADAQAAAEPPPPPSPEPTDAPLQAPPSPEGQDATSSGETILRAQPALANPDLGNDILELPTSPDTASPTPPDDVPEAPIDLAPAPLISAYPIPPALADEAGSTRLIFSSQAPEGEEVVRALLAFLSAPDWQGRIAHVLMPETVRPNMERIYSLVDDGPIPIAQIEFLGATAPDEGEDSFFHCNLHDPAIHGGSLRVVLARQGDSYGVDWVFFAQTYHRLLDLFSATPTEGVYRFNLTLRRVHTLRANFPDIPDLAEKDAFEVACSGNVTQPTVFVRDGSEVALTLKSFIPWRGGRELPQFAVADLRWDSSGGKPIIVIERFHQLGWHPDPEVYATGQVD